MGIFGHGRLRLYLLKLLDESPRHGYEIISLLRDRFLGVYSPSPGTIYPRLARLEEEGLVTHEEVDGRKVYRLTDKGREELRERSADIENLERELTDSMRDIANAVKEDVRHTISGLREELKFLAGDTRRQSREREGAAEGGDVWEQAKQEEETAGGSGGESAGEQREAWWSRDWERIAHNWTAWGSTWARSEERRPELDRALHEFGERVRGLFRDAGQVGGGASENLRGILNETVELIRRDMANWGPPESGPQKERPEEGKSAGAETGEEAPRNAETPQDGEAAQDGEAPQEGTDRKE